MHETTLADAASAQPAGPTRSRREEGREGLRPDRRGLGWAGPGWAGLGGDWLGREGVPGQGAPASRSPFLAGRTLEHNESTESSWRRPWSRGCRSQTCSCSPGTVSGALGAWGPLPGNFVSPLPHRLFSTVTCVEPAVLGGESFPCPRLGLGPKASRPGWKRSLESQGWG